MTVTNKFVCKTCNREIHKVVAISDHIAMPHEEATTN
jgi:mannitol/fructose-specific phosphotransferase system IIA component